MNKTRVLMVLTATAVVLSLTPAATYAVTVGQPFSHPMREDIFSDSMIEDPSADVMGLNLAQLLETYFSFKALNVTIANRSTVASDLRARFSSTATRSAVANEAIGADLETVPEPFTILGTGLALGFGGLLHREYSRKQKTSKQKTQ
ncbi:PEP-CTERM putative exosortase interaction domain-containing protein [Pleurocapsa sp. PCC 7327]|uniref:PEP-CTERM sorting domain-containing protein n=1 Tax=Pleurocapsa sp. PCC 7327 TaxID=118163 RepID=UPI00029F89E4|nr:PEP-CTERM sorting domain-containing protein [Pleurocapsa sp. PCC 7327]AFY76747.1 PEP-CTERM putative exosortase interaction domain-containing protein [Pleurocapsa sp. PCC 7327]